MSKRPEDIPRTGPLRSIADALVRAKPYLRERYHVRALGIFGSYIRNEQGPESGLDEPIGRDVADEKVDRERMLGVSVDLALKGGIARRPRLMHTVEAEAVYV